MNRKNILIYGSVTLFIFIIAGFFAVNPEAFQGNFRFKNKVKKVEQRKKAPKAQKNTPSPDPFNPSGTPKKVEVPIIKVAQPQTINSCTKNFFHTAFILLYEDEKQITPERLSKLNLFKDRLPEAFAFATSGLAGMTVENTVTKIKLTNDLLFKPEINGKKHIEFDKIAQKFYETHEDIYDFLVLAYTFGESEASTHITITQNILGKGQDEEPSIAETYGSKGYLKGFTNLTALDKFMVDETTNPLNLLLHEIGHQWCCFVGDDMQGGKNDAKLEIIQQGIHLYQGLESSYEAGTPLGGNHWIPNGDGTWRVDFSKEYLGNYKKYHPFQLYFMGLLPKDQYDMKFPVYDAGGYSGKPINKETAPLYKKVSVNDIIQVEGERRCKN